MAHWAELDNENKVIRVLVGDNNAIEGDEGFTWIKNNLGGRWIKTSYNKNFRKNFAGVGYYYDEVKDAFIPPKPFNSWILDEECQWQAPKKRPSNIFTIWDENKLDWVEPL